MALNQTQLRAVFFLGYCRSTAQQEVVVIKHPAFQYGQALTSFPAEYCIEPQKNINFKQVGYPCHLKKIF